MKNDNKGDPGKKSVLCLYSKHRIYLKRRVLEMEEQGKSVSMSAIVRALIEKDMLSEMPIEPSKNV